MNNLFQSVITEWFLKPLPTFLATKSTTSGAATRQPAAILGVRRVVEARISSIPQKDEPRSGVQ